MQRNEAKMKKEKQQYEASWREKIIVCKKEQRYDALNLLKRNIMRKFWNGRKVKGAERGSNEHSKAFPGEAAKEKCR